MTGILGVACAHSPTANQSDSGTVVWCQGLWGGSGREQLAFDKPHRQTRCRGGSGAGFQEQRREIAKFLGIMTRMRLATREIDPPITRSASQGLAGTLEAYGNAPPMGRKKPRSGDATVGFGVKRHAGLPESR
jgi:hypothetical protein